MSFRKFVKALIPKKFFRSVEPFGHLLEAIIFNIIYGFPARKMKVIGITGTNGKTTTCYMVHRMLVEAGHKTGMMTTVAYGVNNDIYPQSYHMTNVTIPALMKRLKEMKEKKVEWLVLEATSQGLAQNRLWGVPFSVAVMTNITHEHLDWHGSFKNYRDAKRLLFKRTSSNNKGLRTGIINADDESANFFVKDSVNPITYGIKNGDIRAKFIDQKAGGSRFAAVVDGDEYWISCNLPGSFNIYNSMAAVGVGRAVGLDKKQIEDGIAALEGVEGRMTKIDEGQNFEVIVDFAHD